MYAFTGNVNEMPQSFYSNAAHIRALQTSSVIVKSYVSTVLAREG